MTTINTLDPGWDATFAGRGEHGPGHVLRTTTSSRYPGRKIQGVVVSTGQGVKATCDTCGGSFFDFGSGRHEPYLATPGGGRLYLCTGRALP